MAVAGVNEGGGGGGARTTMEELDPPPPPTIRFKLVKVVTLDAEIQRAFLLLDGVVVAEDGVDKETLRWLLLLPVVLLPMLLLLGRLGNAKQEACCNKSKQAKITIPLGDM